MKKILTSIFLAGAIIARAQINITPAVPYQQDFNTLITANDIPWVDNTTLAGWYSNETDIYADDGSDVFGGRLHSYGTGTSTERALGGKAFSSLSEVAIAVRMKNNSNNPISYFQVSCRGEQWRQNTNANTLKFYYQVNATDISNGTWTPVTSLDFPELHTGTGMALDGNLAVNDTSFLIAFPLTLNPLEEVWFKWELIGNSNGPGLAIDDLEIIPSISNPTSVASSTNENSFSLYYNPLSESVLLNGFSPEEKISAMNSYNTMGQKIFELTNTSNKEINVSGWPKGIYFITIQSQKQTLTQKIAIR